MAKGNLVGAGDLNNELAEELSKANKLFADLIYHSKEGAIAYISRLDDSLSNRVIRKRFFRQTIVNDIPIPFHDFQIKDIISRLERSIANNDRSKSAQILTERPPTIKMKFEMYEALQQNKDPEDAKYRDLSRQTLEEIRTLAGRIFEQNFGIFETLAKRYIGKIELDDLAQIAGKHTWLNITSFRGEGEIRAFLYVLGEHGIKNELKSYQRRTKFIRYNESDLGLITSDSLNNSDLEDNRIELEDEIIDKVDLRERLASLVEVMTSTPSEFIKKIFGNAIMTPSGVDVIRLRHGLLENDEKCREIEERYCSGIKLQPATPYDFAEIDAIRGRACSWEIYQLAIQKLSIVINSAEDYKERLEMLRKTVQRATDLLNFMGSNSPAVTEEVFGKDSITVLQAEIIKLKNGLTTEEDCDHTKIKYRSDFNIRPGVNYTFEQIGTIIGGKNYETIRSCYLQGIKKLFTIISLH